jgi:hypothetical protein
MVLWSDSSNNKEKGGLEEGMRNKLVTESIAPWRTIRLFLYGALGSGAFIGGLINISGALAASNSPDSNLQTEVGFIFLLDALKYGPTTDTFVLACCSLSMLGLILGLWL